MIVTVEIRVCLFLFVMAEEKEVDNFSVLLTWAVGTSLALPLVGKAGGGERGGKGGGWQRRPCPKKTKTS